MIKKITLWIVYAGIVGLLVFGAVTRTEARALAGTGGSKSGSASLGYTGTGQAGLGAGEGAGRQLEDQGRRGGNGGEFNRDDQVQAVEYQLVSLEGTVRSVSEELLEINLVDGSALLIEGQTWRYVTSQGFETEYGHKIELAGFFEEGEYKVSWMEDLDTKTEIEIRDSGGRPLWAGRSNRGS